MQLDKKDKFLIQTILLYCDEILRDIDRFSLTKEVIKKDASFRGMLAFFILQIGESSRKLSDDFRGTHPEIEWPAIIGFRNHIAHVYGAIIPDTLWDTVQNDIPELRDFCQKILSSPQEK